MAVEKYARVAAEGLDLGGVETPREVAWPWRAPLGGLARRRERWFYLLISPWLIGFLFLQAGPVLAALFIAFADWPLGGAPRYVGLEHFRGLLADPLFPRTLLNSAYFALGTVPLGIALGFGLASLLNRRARGLPIFRMVFLLPVIISGVATTLVWGWVLNPRYGLINAMLAEVGIRGPAWLQDETWAMPSLILINLWMAGVNMLIYLAALKGVPRELYEASAIDGAGRWQRFRSITWPMLSPVTFSLLVINLIGSFQVFTPIYILTRGGPNNATLTLPLYIYLNAFAWGRLGYASALAFVLFLVILMLTLLLFRFAERRVYYAGGKV